MASNSYPTALESRCLARSSSPARAQLERMKPENDPLPFDAKRLIYGGFEVLFDV